MEIGEFSKLLVKKMVKKKLTGSVLTKSEEKLIEALKISETVKLAALKVGIKTKTAYNILYRLRRKYLKARRFVNYVEAQKRRHDLVTMVLTHRMMERELEEDDEDFD